MLFKSLTKGMTTQKRFVLNLVVYSITILFVQDGFGQKTDTLVFAYPCEQTLDWVIKTVVENDAAAPTVLEQKGETAHEEHILAAKVLAKESRNIDECRAALTHYIHFFRESRIFVSSHALVNRFAKIDQDKLAKVQVNLDEFADYVAKLKEPTLEGYWKIDDHLVGIKEVDGEYIGFNIDAHNSIWKPKQIKVRFKLNEEGIGSGTYKNVFFEESPINHIHLADANHISVNDSELWERQRSTFSTNPQIAKYIELNNTKYSSLIKMNDSTYVLKIPRFAIYEYERLSAIIEDLKELRPISHLIIDLRFTAGYDESLFELLFPLIYTDPIFSDAIEIRSSKLNNALYASQFDESTMNWLEKRRLKKRLKKLNSSLNKYVSFNSLNKSLVYEQKQVNPFPKQITILTHWSNSYGLEEFIELTKQSRKVQLVGTNTAGTLGLTGMNRVSSPDARYTLSYATARVKNLDKTTTTLLYCVEADIIFNELETPHYLRIEEVIKRSNESLK